MTVAWGFNHRVWPPPWMGWRYIWAMPLVLVWWACITVPVELWRRFGIWWSRAWFRVVNGEWPR